MPAREFVAALVMPDCTPAEAVERLGYGLSTIRKGASGHALILEEVIAWLRPYASRAGYLACPASAAVAHGRPES